jgi:3-phosphoglycerate kinase
VIAEKRAEIRVEFPDGTIALNRKIHADLTPIRGVLQVQRVVVCSGPGRVMQDNAQNSIPTFVQVSRGKISPRGSFCSCHMTSGVLLHCFVAAF